MYEFIRVQWVLGKYNESNLNKGVMNGYITPEQAVEIMNMARVPE